MQNIFIPSDTIACIEQKYVGKTYRVKGAAYSEPLTKERINKLFKQYVRTIEVVFAGRAIVMQRTRALKNGTIVPVTSYEYVYSDGRGVMSYVDEGYYAVTVNGYRMNDILDSAYHFFTDSIDGARAIIDKLSITFEAKPETVETILSRFFFTSGYESFNSYLYHIVEGDLMDETDFDICASYVCSFGDDLPAINDAIDIYKMSKAAQSEGLAVDECDLDGWKGKAGGRNLRAFWSFFNGVVNRKGAKPDDEEPDFDQEDDGSCHLPCQSKENCDCAGCTEPDEDLPVRESDEDEADPEKDDAEEADGLDEIRKDIDKSSAARKIPVKEEEHVTNSEVDLSTASDGNKYTYTITWKDNDGKGHSKTFYGDTAKKMMGAKDDSPAVKWVKDNGDAKLTRPSDGETINDALRSLKARIDNIEKGIAEKLAKKNVPFVRPLFPRRGFGSVFDWNDLFGGF